MTGGGANNGAKDTNGEHGTGAVREPQQKVRKVRTDVHEGRQRECEHYYIGDEDTIHTHYRVRGESEPGRLLKRKK